MSNKPLPKRRAEADQKNSAQVNFYLNDSEQADLESVKEKLKILPGTAKAVLTHYVFAAGLKALLGTK